MTVAHGSTPTPPSPRVALLRGVNLGPSTQLSMPALVSAARGLGWTEVSTYLRSGNLIFTAAGSDAQATEALCEAVARECGMDVAMVIRDRDRLQAALDHHPFADGDPARTVLACADRAIEAAAVERLMGLAGDGEQVQVDGTEIYAAFPQGQARSKLAAGLVAACRPAVVTARNLNTVRRLVELLER